MIHKTRHKILNEVILFFHRSWYLHISNVQDVDRGWYMCQVNTDPMRSRQGYLQVVGKLPWE